MTTTVNDGQPWRAQWQATAGEDRAQEFSDLLRIPAGSGRRGPEDVQGRAFAAAEAAEAARDALGHGFAPCTPKQAAAVASALLSQLSAGAAALQHLVSALQAVQLRGGAGLPDGGPLGEPVDSARAMHTLDALGEAVGRLVEREGVRAVRQIQAIPPTPGLPAEPHDALARPAASAVKGSG
ncbi:hypothetical protein [Kitasatospora sp. NPDC051914]|uniref:hypothetical protein n=1 Tax=Kitasatospora sp. NPDC051914 TaxID=3154945 RepID=UPI00342FC12A